VIRIPRETNRYLIRFDTGQLGHLYTDTLVIGSGVAGLRAAIEAAQAGGVIVLAKETSHDSNTYYAQGGIAAVSRPEDSIASHIEDTLRTGCGLCDAEVVKLVIENGPAQLEQLLQWSMPFDVEDGSIAVGCEGGHSHHRIVHSHGDATGEALALCLLGQVGKKKAIKIFEHCFCIDLLTQNRCCRGVLCYHPAYGLQCIWARKTILATGGAGGLYRETTNPVGATADGLAMAYRAGAILTDLEFMQFHPTALYVAGASRTLITEALRGAGGYLLDRDGHRFMADYHKMAELAPRDVVSRAIYQQMAQTRATNVFLDVRHKGAQWLERYFPTISRLCASFDIDVDSDLIPVRPSAHYMVGGVKTDKNGSTNIENLYCCGETAATGLHGGNRLASNSLLEGLVFGQICGRAAAQAVADDHGQIQRHNIVSEIPDSERTKLDLPDVTNSLRAVMWRNVGIERHGDRLDDFWRRYIMDKVFGDPLGWQCQNMLTVCRLIGQFAGERRESRGTHYRSDYPRCDDENFKQHIEVTL